MFSKISLEQWRAFVATVECGGFLQAAEHLFKSQSAVSHSVNRMEVLLGHELFIIEGRKAVLTPLGQALLPQAKHLLGAAQKLEQLANQYQPGLFNELALAVDVLFPLELLQEALQGYSATSRTIVFACMKPHCLVRASCWKTARSSWELPAACPLVTCRNCC